MELNDMADLIEAYDGLRELEDIMGALNGSGGAGYDEGAMGKLCRITDVIQRNVADKDPEDDWDGILRILDDDETPAEDRAKALLGIV